MLTVTVRGNQVSDDDVRNAMKRFDRDLRGGFKLWKRWAIAHNGRQYPPKKILQIIFPGRSLGELPTGGEPTNHYFRELGFTVVERDSWVSSGSNRWPSPDEAVVAEPDEYDPHDDNPREIANGSDRWLGADEADESDEVEPISEGEYEPSGEDRREIAERQVLERRGQGKFREALRERYGDRCQITECDLLHVLQAAHIVPYRGPEDHHLDNGLLLRADIHTLFDLYLLGIHPETLKVEVHGELPEEYHRLEGKTISRAGSKRPSHQALQWHHERFCERRRDPA